MKKQNYAPNIGIAGSMLLIIGSVLYVFMSGEIIGFIIATLGAFATMFAYGVDFALKYLKDKESGSQQ